MSLLLAMLEGGDRRSIGRSNEVVAAVLRNPASFGQVMQGMSHQDRLVRMRSADAAEKISAIHPEYLEPYQRYLFALAESPEQELRWHVAQMLPRPTLSRSKRARAVNILLDYAHDQSSIVRTHALQALAEFALVDAKLRKPVVAMLVTALQHGSPAMQARSRKLLERFPDVHASPQESAP